MADVAQHHHHPSIPQQEIQHAALEHDIRTVQTRTETNLSRRKSLVLDTYRTELFAKVDDHLAELHHLEESRERTAQFKEEMLAKVNEHLAELERESAKVAEVSRIKGELLYGVHRHAKELERMDDAYYIGWGEESIGTYKDELLERAEAHVTEMELAHEKGVQVRRFSLEMREKIKEHEAHLAERAEVAAKLKREIIKEAHELSRLRR